jgi:hypothetical protein
LEEQIDVSQCGTNAYDKPARPADRACTSLGRNGAKAPLMINKNTTRSPAGSDLEVLEEQIDVSQCDRNAYDKPARPAEQPQQRATRRTSPVATA